MALAAITRAEIRNRAYDRYGEVAGGYQFSTAGMNTAIQRAVELFAQESGCLLGSARRARPSSTTGEALLTLPTGMWGVNRVVHERAQYAGAATKSDLPHATVQYLSLAYGDEWPYASSAVVGGANKEERWYRKGARQLGLYPAYLAHTAGTVVVWGRVAASSVMANDTSPCEIPPEFIPGVVDYTCMYMAQRDVDADAEGARAETFRSSAQTYVELAANSSRQTWDIED